jgi:hypothetical protein
MDGIVNLFKSRKAVLALVALVVHLVITFAPPDVAAKAVSAGGAVYFVIAVAIFGIAAEDAVKHWSERPVTFEEEIQDIQEEFPPLGTPDKPF